MRRGLRLPMQWLAALPGAAAGKRVMGISEERSCRHESGVWLGKEAVTEGAANALPGGVSGAFALAHARTPTAPP